MTVMFRVPVPVMNVVGVIVMRDSDMAAAFGVHLLVLPMNLMRAGHAFVDVVALAAVELGWFHEQIAGRSAHRSPGAGGAASRCSFRLVHIRRSWRIPIQVITGPSSRKAPLGRTCPDHRIRVPTAAGSNISV